MKVVQVSQAKGPLETVERDIPQPGAGEVRVKTEACGICHSDMLTKEGLFPGLKYPRVPGHEVIGTIDALGDGVNGWESEQRVGLGWHAGSCGQCNPCRHGQLYACEKAGVHGITRDGGYGEYVLARTSSIARVPDSLTSEEAAPLMCAGLTTFNALRNSGARAGDTVAILGLGGLGHLGVQFAAKMGFQTIAIARGQDKAAFAKKLGASNYIDSEAGNPGIALKKLGGARVILSTVTNGPAVEAVLGGLGLNGELMIVGVPEKPIALNVMTMIPICGAVRAWYSGTAADAEDTMAFAALTGVRSMNEVLPLEKAAEGYDRMMSGKARFRVVLKH